MAGYSTGKRLDDSENEVRVLLVGDNDVGKTAIFNRFMSGQFEEGRSADRNRSSLFSECTKHISSEGREAKVSRSN